MICLLDAIAMGPLMLLGGAIMILIIALGLMSIATIALMIVKWTQHRKKKEQKQPESDSTQEPQI